MKRFSIALGLALLLPLGGCADRSGYSTGYYDRSGYYDHYHYGSNNYYSPYSGGDPNYYRYHTSRSYYDGIYNPWWPY